MWNYLDWDHVKKPIRNVFDLGKKDLTDLTIVNTGHTGTEKIRFDTFLPVVLFFSPKLFNKSQRLTLFFSNFQLSSWARICSTTDMASRPSLTYSFSCEDTNGQNDSEQILTQVSRTCAILTCNLSGSTYLSSDSSTPHTLFIQIFFRAWGHNIKAAAEVDRGKSLRTTHNNCSNHLQQIRAESRTVHLTQLGGRPWGHVHKLHSLLLSRLQCQEGKGIWMKREVLLSFHLVSNLFFSCFFSPLSPLSSSASCVSTLKSRNQVSSQATTKEVMGKT